MLENKVWHNSFISKNNNYCLIDKDRDIRATSSTIEGIAEAKKQYGFGEIYPIRYDGKVLKIDKRLK